jgi:hypothetical protein
VVAIGEALDETSVEPFTPLADEIEDALIAGTQHHPRLYRRIACFGTYCLFTSIACPK